MDEIPGYPGNRTCPATDYHRVNCGSCREALSARLDGEEQPGERAVVEAHLAGCPGCRRWFDDAAAVTRLARTAPAPVAPGVPDLVLDAAPTGRRATLARVLRWVLAGLGVAQFFLSLTQIGRLAGQAHVHTGQPASPGHLWHESAAWNLAVGAGFAWVAARRARPAAIAPVLTVFLATLALLSLDDLAAGRVEGAWLLSHGFILTGYVIILLLGRPALDVGDPPSRRGRSRSGSGAGAHGDAGTRPAAVPGRPSGDRSTPAARRRDAA